MSFTGVLHPYQVDDVARMVDRQSMLVAYSQGTGKTPMTIAAIETLMDTGEISEAGLIVCLDPLKYQWAKAIRKFTCSTCDATLDEHVHSPRCGADCPLLEHDHAPTSTPLVIDGTSAQRQAQLDTAAQWHDSGIDYVIMNYDAVSRGDADALPTGFVVADEASFIRGFRSNRAKAVKALRSDVRFALTGTPIENGRPEEVFSIMEFVDTRVFGPFYRFDPTFIVRNDNGWVSRYRNIPLFRRTLDTAMVRRTHDDPAVAPYMPAVEHKDPLLVPLDRAARSLYTHIQKELLLDLAEAEGSFTTFDIYAHYGRADAEEDGALKGRIASKMLNLRLLCDHPDLIRRSAHKFTTTTTSGSAYANDLLEAGLLENVVKHPKLDAVMKWLSLTLEADDRNKVVIFSRYVEMCEILGTTLASREIGYRDFTGRLSAKVKEQNKTEFQSLPDVRVLVSSDAGGYGIDLPQANYLVNYDQPDAGGLADQRDTRIVRASSEFATVEIHVAAVRGSIEEHDLSRLDHKRSVSAAFIDGRGVNRRGGVNTDLESLTKFMDQVHP